MSRMRHSNRRSRALLTAALVALPPVVPSAVAAKPRRPAAPPIARKKPTLRELHGDKFVDDYFWLREKGNPEVKAYLEAENAHADAVMAPYKGLQDTLYKEMLGRIKETDLTVPVREGGYFYYTRTEQGQQYTDLLPQEGQPRRARGGLPRRQRAGEGRGLHGHRHHERQRRRQPARVHDRHHRLPRVQALRARPAHRRAAGAAGREGHVGRLGGGQQDAVLHDDRRRQAALSPLSPRHRRGRRRHDALRGEGRALQRRRRPVAQQGLPVPRDRQPDDVRGALPGRRPAGRRRGRSSRRARTTTSTTSTTAAISSSSAPTRAAATSRWRWRR